MLYLFRTKRARVPEKLESKSSSMGAVLGQRLNFEGLWFPTEPRASCSDCPSEYSGKRYTPFPDL